MIGTDDILLDNILKNTVNVMESSKTQIFDIYESARIEVDHLEAEIDTLKKKVSEIIAHVDILERKEHEARRTLVQVSSNFSVYNEADIKLCYDNARNIQVELAVMREQEQNMRQQRTFLELRLKRFQATMVKAKQLVAQVGVVLGYLSAQIGEAVTKMEMISQDKLFAVQIIQAQEDERLRVSREIHDGPAQVIANVIYRSSVCERLVEIDKDKAKRELREIREQIRGCLGEVRKIIFDLRPMTLDDLGLVATIHQFIEKFKKRTGIAVWYEVLGTEYKLDKHVEISVFRMVQESLNNVHKHAKATEAKLILEYNAEYISLFVEDYGQGFFVDDLKNSKEKSECYGLMGMKERVKMLSGQILIDSMPGRGTKIRILLPMQNARERSDAT